MSSPKRPTTPDLVLLSLLCEKPRHGYDIVAELERREVQDWAGVSRPQVYYSLRKLAAQDWIAPFGARETDTGAERQIYTITDAGRDALQSGLARDEWAIGRVLSPFLTWLALSPHTDRATAATMLARRATFLAGEIERENTHLPLIRAHVGESGVVAELMVTHKIAQWEAELRWLDRVRDTLFADNSAKS